MIIATELQGSDFSPNLITLSDSDLLFLKRSSRAFYETSDTDLKVGTFTIQSVNSDTQITLNQTIPEDIKLKYAYIIVKKVVAPFIIYYTRKITEFTGGNTITVDAFSDNFLEAGLSCFIYEKTFLLANGDDGTVDAARGKTATSIDLSMRDEDVSGILPPIMITDYRIPASLYIDTTSILYDPEDAIQDIYRILLDDNDPGNIDASNWDNQDWTNHIESLISEGSYIDATSSILYNGFVIRDASRNPVANIDFCRYVKEYADLERDFDTNGGSRHMAQYGYDHYKENGRGENRVLVEFQPQHLNLNYGFADLIFGDCKVRIRQNASNKSYQSISLSPLSSNADGIIEISENNGVWILNYPSNANCRDLVNQINFAHKSNEKNAFATLDATSSPNDRGYGLIAQIIQGDENTSLDQASANFSQSSENYKFYIFEHGLATGIATTDNNARKITVDSNRANNFSQLSIPYDTYNLNLTNENGDSITRSISIRSSTTVTILGDDLPSEFLNTTLTFTITNPLAVSFLNLGTPENLLPLGLDNISTTDLIRRINELIYANQA